MASHQCHKIRTMVMPIKDSVVTTAMVSYLLADESEESII